MISHPNRSKSATLRYVVYSLTFHNALTSDGNFKAALDRCRHPAALGSYVVFTTRSREDIYHFDGGRWPRDARIVWRGADELSQSYDLTLTTLDIRRIVNSLHD